MLRWFIFKDVQWAREWHATTPSGTLKFWRLKLSCVSCRGKVPLGYIPLQKGPLIFVLYWSFDPLVLASYPSSHFLCECDYLIAWSDLYKFVASCQRQILVSLFMLKWHYILNQRSWGLLDHPPSPPFFLLVNVSLSPPNFFSDRTVLVPQFVPRRPLRDLLMDVIIVFQ